MDIGEVLFLWEFESKVDYLMMNEDEYRCKYGSFDLSFCRVKNFVVMLNGGGVFVREGDNVFEVRGLSVKVVDLMGVGDFFDVGVIYGVFNGWFFFDFVKFGMLFVYLIV